MAPRNGSTLRGARKLRFRFCLLDRQIMDIKMTGQAVRIFGVERRIVRRPVTIGAFRHLRCFDDEGTQFTLPCCSILPLGVNLPCSAAGTAGFLVYVT